MDDKNLPTRLEKVTTLVFIRVNQRFLVGMGATWGGLVFLSSFSDCWLDQLLFNTCLHRRSPIPPTTHLSAVRQREPSWEELVLLGVCFLYLYIYMIIFFFFYKGPSGLPVCISDRLDLIPGLIQSVSERRPALLVMALISDP